MENIGAWGGIILWLVCGFVVWRLYHKIFTVYYFNLGRGIAIEIFFCWLIGGILAGLIITFLPIALVIVGIVILIIVLKKRSDPKGAEPPVPNAVHNHPVQEPVIPRQEPMGAQVAGAVVTPAQQNGFSLGETVFARWKPDGYYYPGVIKQVLGESFKISFLDGDTDQVTKEHIVRLQEAFSIMRFEGNWKKRGGFYMGVISSNEPLVMNYDDGDVEQIEIRQLRGMPDFNRRTAVPIPSTAATVPAAPVAGQSSCANCGTEYIPGQMLFCRQCGNKLDVAETHASEPAAEPTPNPVCAQCNTTNVSDAVFCSTCGNKF